jgi:hypothetical protein
VTVTVKANDVVIGTEVLQGDRRRFGGAGSAATAWTDSQKMRHITAPLTHRSTC